MKRIAEYILLLFLLVSCNHKPWGVLSHEEMVDVLFDVHLAESTINVKDPYSRRIEKQEYYNSVFEKHNITKEEFDESLDWYARHPKKMVLVYDDVKAKAESFKTDVEDYKYHPEMRPTHNDSIDTLDLWYWRKLQQLERRDTIDIPIDSLHFRITNSEYLENAEEWRFYLKMAAVSDSVDSLLFKTRLIYCHDSVYDTLQCETKADSIYRNYYINKILPDTIQLDSLLIELIDSTHRIKQVNIDSVELQKVYNNYEHPIVYRIKKEIESKRDSINKKGEKKLEVRNKETRKKLRNRLFTKEKRINKI